MASRRVHILNHYYGTNHNQVPDKLEFPNTLSPKVLVERGFLLVNREGKCYTKEESEEIIANFDNDIVFGDKYHYTLPPKLKA